MTTLADARARLAGAARRAGTGRFALTLSEGGGPACYLTHWFRPEPLAFEQCRAVAQGSVEECLAALDRYVDGFPIPTTCRRNAARAASSSTGNPSSASST